MAARIFRPARSAMQSGKGNTKDWLLVFDARDAKTVEPLMGYTSTGDMRSQIRLSFESKEQAIAYAERYGIAYRVEEEHVSVRPRVSYTDNFRADRNQPWTH